MTETIETLLKNQLNRYLELKKTGVVTYNFENINDIINDLKDSLNTIEV